MTGHSFFDDNSPKWWMYIIFIILAIVMFKTMGSYDDDERFLGYKEKYFNIIIEKKYKDKTRNYFLLVYGFDLNLQTYKEYDMSFLLSSYNPSGLENFYEYIQKGDTIIKHKDSVEIYVKNGSRSKTFVGKPFVKK